MQRSYLFVMDPIKSINPKTDSTFYLMLESQNRGIKNWYCQLNDLIVFDGKGFAQAYPVEVSFPSEKSSCFFRLGPKQTISFAECDVIFMRKDPPVDQNFISACLLLNFYNPQKTLAFNDPKGLLLANEKLWGLNIASYLMPKTVVSSNINVLLDAAQHLEKVVIKPLYEAGGSGILIMNKDDSNLRPALEMHTNHGQRPCILQQFLNGASQGDKRVILLGGKPVGAFLRVPKEKEHRSNLHVGGTSQKTELTTTDHQIAHALKPHLLKLGIHFAGIDIIDNKLTEINVTSPTGLQEIDKIEERAGANKLNVQIINYIEQLLMQRNT